ncbi:hypothetical protein AAY473_027984, partial [Plecturocebus cupreus]
MRSTDFGICKSSVPAEAVGVTRDLWNFELEKDDLGYLVEEISKQQSIQEEAEHKNLENLQPDNVIEKKNPYSEEKFKLAAEICISVQKTRIEVSEYPPRFQRMYGKAWMSRQKFAAGIGFDIKDISLLLPDKGYQVPYVNLCLLTSNELPLRKTRPSVDPYIINSAFALQLKSPICFYASLIPPDKGQESSNKQMKIQPSCCEKPMTHFG